MVLVLSLCRPLWPVWWWDRYLRFSVIPGISDQGAVPDAERSGADKQKDLAQQKSYAVVAKKARGGALACG
jgi:hypothetical protein